MYLVRDDSMHIILWLISLSIILGLIYLYSLDGADKATTATISFFTGAAAFVVARYTHEKYTYTWLHDIKSCDMSRNIDRCVNLIDKADFWDKFLYPSAFLMGVCVLIFTASGYKYLISPQAKE
jgi:hypothetical protein